MSVLVDSSVWISYFRGTENHAAMDSLIDNDILVINDLILAELVPILNIQKQHKLINLLMELKRPDISIDWDNIIKMQVTCLRSGINKVGISDLIIAQQAVNNDFDLFTYDKHFMLISKHIPLSLYQQ